ncbi:MAG TPA: hypothetical protein VH682_22215 [Gemmataceae bacterium]
MPQRPFLCMPAGAGVVPATRLLPEERWRRAFRFSVLPVSTAGSASWDGL